MHFVTTDLGAVTPASRALAARAWPMVLSELPPGVQQRPSRQEPYKVVLDVLLANVISAEYEGLPCVVPQRKAYWANKARSRYHTQELTHPTVPTMTRALEAAGLVSVRTGSRFAVPNGSKAVNGRGEPQGRVTELTALEPLIHLIRRYGVLPPSYGLISGAEVAILKASRADSDPEHQDRQPNHAEWKEYAHQDEDNTVERSRKFVRRLNAHTRASLIEYSGEHEAHRSNIQYRRYYNSVDDSIRWDLGGRFFGHWAQWLPASERKHLTIADPSGNQRPVADVDYGAMAVTLLYAKYGEPIPARPYDLPGMNRKGVKKLIAAVLNDRRQRTRLPIGFRQYFPERAWSFRKIEAAIFDHLPLVQEHAYKSEGLNLMHHESNIALLVMKELMASGIGFVCLHDGFLVPDDHEIVTLTQRIMTEVFEIYTRVQFTVSTTPTVTVKRY